MECIDAFRNREKSITLAIEFAIYLLLFLFVYGAMLHKYGYHWDETLDFQGGGMDTYLVNGRWGLAIWRYVFGIGPVVWPAGCIVCVMLSFFLVLVSKLLEINSFVYKVAFGMLYVLIPQYAYMMSYSMQSDAVAFGLFLMATAVFFIIKGGWQSILLSVLLFAFSVGVYQTLALTFVALTAIVFIHKCLKNELYDLSFLIKGAVVSILGMFLYLVIRYSVEIFCPVDSNVLNWVKEGQANMCNHSWNSLSEFLLYLIHYSKEVVITAVYTNSFSGENIYSCAMIFLCVLLFVVWKKKGLDNIGRIFVSFMLLFVWVVPFLMILVMGNVWPCLPHTRLTEPLVFASLGIMSLPYIPKSKNLYLLLSLLLLVGVMRSSIHVGKLSARERGAFECRLYKLLRMEEEACAIAKANGISLTDGNILYFKKNEYKFGGLEYYCVDFCGDYPALRYMRYGYKSEEIKRHQETLSKMPCWPANGSIIVDKGVVLIHGDTI